MNLRCKMFNNVFLILCIVTTIQAEDTVTLIKDLRVTLPSGDRMPVVGFGTAGIIGDNVKDVLDNALASGYRLFDTGYTYGNEADLGKALKELLPKHNLTRKDIFITTKLAPNLANYGEHAYQALKKSLQNLDFDYVDLYLIHFPGLTHFEPTTNYSKLRDESWKKLVKGQNNGLARNIGVSNYNLRHLKELFNNDHGVKPAVNQVEWHPDYYQKDLLKYCKQEGVQLQAYLSLGGATNKTRLLDNPEVNRIAKKLNKSPAQVLLRWAVQQDVLVIPRTRGRKHMEENIDLNFEIPDAEMKALSSFEQVGKYLWNPDKVI